MRYSTVYRNDIAKAAGVIPDVKNLYGKRVLITGGTGIIGSAVTDLLIYLNRDYGAGITITLAGRNEEKVRNSFGKAIPEQKIQFLKYDMLQPSELDTEADCYIHCAGIACPGLYRKYPVETLMGTVSGLDTVLRSAGRNPRSRVLLVSSSEVYGNRPTECREPFREEEYAYVDSLSPRSCYPNGKRAAETLCASYREEYGVDYSAARPGYVYGPSIAGTDNRASSAFVRDAAAGRPIIMKSRGEQMRSYCYAVDCASALLTILVHGKSGEAYNISNRNSIASIYEFAETAAEAGGVEIIRSQPSDDEMKSYTPMTHAVLDSTKLEALGWKGLWNLREGIGHTVEALRKAQHQ